MIAREGGCAHWGGLLLVTNAGASGNSKGRPDLQLKELEHENQ